MQKICSSNPPMVTGICDPKKSRALHHHSLKLGLKKKYLKKDNVFYKKKVGIVLVSCNSATITIYIIVIGKFSNRSIQNLFNVDKGTCMDSCKLCSKSGIVFFLQFLVFVDLLFQLHVFWQHLMSPGSVKNVTLLHIIMTYVKENMITKLKNYTACPETLWLVINHLWLFFLEKKPPCMDNISPICKIFIERPGFQIHMYIYFVISSIGRNKTKI